MEKKILKILIATKIELFILFVIRISKQNKEEMCVSVGAKDGMRPASRAEHGGETHRIM
jgi:hypothetical protein